MADLLMYTQVLMMTFFNFFLYSEFPFCYFWVSQLVNESVK